MSALEDGGGGVVVHVIHKLRAIQQAQRLCKTKECRPCDVAVLAYLTDSMDNKTGIARRCVRQIAQQCGMGRSTVIDALGRLTDAGVITIEARHARNGAQIASDYRLGDCAFESNSSVQKGDPPVQDSNTHSSQRHLIPIGNQLRKASNRYGSAKDSPGEDRADQAAKLSGESAPRADWDDLATWLYRQGKYTEQWGFGARALAVDDLERLRREKGHGPLLRAIEIAKSKRLFGEALISFLENTYATRRRRSSRSSARA